MEQDFSQKQRYQELLSILMEAREQKDKSQWVIGDAAVEFVTLYGRAGLPQFAIEGGVNKDTMRRYLLVSQAWPPDKRLPYLSHRHHQILAPRTDRFEWAEKAHDNNWSCEMLEVEMGKYDGKIDKTFLSVAMSFVPADLERVYSWYNLALEKWPERLSEADHPVAKRIKEKIVNANKGKV